MLNDVIKFVCRVEKLSLSTVFIFLMLTSMIIDQVKLFFCKIMKTFFEKSLVMEVFIFNSTECVPTKED